MRETGYLWLVLCPLGGGYEIQNSKTGEITYAINSEYKNIAGICMRFETGEKYEPCGVILTKSNELQLVGKLPVLVIPIVPDKSLSPANNVQVVPLEANVTDVDGNTFTIIAVDESESSPQSSGLVHPKLTVEFTNYIRNVS